MSSSSSSSSATEAAAMDEKADNKTSIKKIRIDMYLEDGRKASTPLTSEQRVSYFESMLEIVRKRFPSSVSFKLYDDGKARGCCGRRDCKKDQHKNQGAVYMTQGTAEFDEPIELNQQQLQDFAASIGAQNPFLPDPRESLYRMKQYVADMNRWVALTSEFKPSYMNTSDLARGIAKAKEAMTCFQDVQTILEKHIETIAKPEQGQKQTWDRALSTTKELKLVEDDAWYQFVTLPSGSSSQLIVGISATVAPL